MDALVTFFTQYGLPLTGIAILGVIILGVMKYCNLFQKIKEETRHYVYIGISAGLSIVGAAIYLACTGNFDMPKLIAIATAMYAINQAFYNIYKVTPLQDLILKILEKIFKEKDFKNDKTKEEPKE